MLPLICAFLFESGRLVRELLPKRGCTSEIPGFDALIFVSASFSLLLLGKRTVVNLI